MTTPRMSQHAQERCAQMGIRTKRAKRIVQERNICYEGTGHDNGGMVCQSAADPEIAVVWDPGTNVILTVIPRTQESYQR